MRFPLIPPTHIQSQQHLQPLPQCQCRSEQHKAFLFLALVLLEIYDIVLHVVFDPVEKACQTFHSIFEPFLLALA
jgi:hypothetical protein